MFRKVFSLFVIVILIQRLALKAGVDWFY